MISLQLISWHWPFKSHLNLLMTILLKKEAGDIVKTLFCQYQWESCEENLEARRWWRREVVSYKLALTSIKRQSNQLYFFNIFVKATSNHLSLKFNYSWSQFDLIARSYD